MVLAFVFAQRVFFGTVCCLSPCFWHFCNWTEKYSNTCWERVQSVVLSEGCARYAIKNVEITRAGSKYFTFAF